MSSPQSPQSVQVGPKGVADPNAPLDEPVAPKGGAEPTTATPPAHTGPGVVKRTTITVKRVLLVVIGALIALFAVFNSQNVSVNWIFGKDIQSPLILVIVVAFIAGAAIGWLVAKLGRRSARSNYGDGATR
jgi:uncharacterized integral membrane protein